MGIAFGAMAPLRMRYFGRKSIGSIMGTSRACALPAGILAPIWTGWMYDTTGSYIFAFTVIAGLLSFASVVALFILPPKPPASDIALRQEL
jgi:hypothetical protein